jgi:L-ascorbate metabolism protein UlaG (beta-lactamase superfamily)
MPLTAAFLGAATLLIEDGETHLLTDGFFTRPALLRVLLGKIKPRSETIAAGLSRAGITRLDAVLVGHSHYDHAMDSPEVARRTGAVVVGSQSTANIARGWGLPESQIRVQPGQALLLGAFRVTFIPSPRLPLHFPAGSPPARSARARSAYRERRVRNLDRASLRQPAGPREAPVVGRGLAGVRAGAAFVSVANLSRRAEEREACFRE